MVQVVRVVSKVLRALVERVEFKVLKVVLAPMVQVEPVVFKAHKVLQAQVE